jgi:hypothetical protein
MLTTKLLIISRSRNANYLEKRTKSTVALVFDVVAAVFWFEVSMLIYLRKVLGVQPWAER